MALLHARDVEIKLQTAGSVTIAADDVFNDQFGSSQTIITAKSMELDEGEQAFDQQNYLGEATSGYQNQDKVQKPKGMATLTITADMEDLSAIQELLYDTSTSATTHTTYQQGNAAPKEVDVLVDATQTAQEFSAVLLNAQQTAPMTKVTGVDGNLEYEIKLNCLAKDFLGIQWKD